MISQVNSYDIIDLKRRLGIETTLAIHYTTYESGSNKVIERGYIHQKADGDIKKEIQTLVTGSVGITWIRLIYYDLERKEPVIRRVMYEHNNQKQNRNGNHQNQTEQSNQQNR